MVRVSDFRILAATVSASPLVWSRKGQGWLQTFTHGRVEATEPAVSQSLRSQHHSSRLSAFCKGNWRSPAFGMNCFAGQYNVIVKVQRSCLKWMSTTYLPLKARRFARFSFSFSPVSVASSQNLAELEGADCVDPTPQPSPLPSPIEVTGKGEPNYVSLYYISLRRQKSWKQPSKWRVYEQIFSWHKCGGHDKYVERFLYILYKRRFGTEPSLIVEETWYREYRKKGEETFTSVLALYCPAKLADLPFPILRTVFEVFLATWTVEIHGFRA